MRGRHREGGVETSHGAKRLLRFDGLPNARRHARDKRHANDLAAHSRNALVPDFRTEAQRSIWGGLVRPQLQSLLTRVMNFARGPRFSGNWGCEVPTFAHSAQPRGRSECVTVVDAQLRQFFHEAQSPSIRSQCVLRQVAEPGPADAPDGDHAASALQVAARHDLHDGHTPRNLCLVTSQVPKIRKAEHTKAVAQGAIDHGNPARLKQVHALRVPQQQEVVHGKEDQREPSRISQRLCGHRAPSGQASVEVNSQCTGTIHLGSTFRPGHSARGSVCHAAPRDQ
mmetsp:Transcript_75131/g.208975  ORF Transcript_75131/g.208975 Transcript_75131/m.208975 type:complete len:283 (+) Transcript_75131:283-1131(+)